MEEVGTHRFIADEEFWVLLHQLFSQRYLQRYLDDERTRRDYHNWLEYLNLTWNVISVPDPKTYKKYQTAFDVLKNNLAAIYDLDEVTLRYKLDLEHEELGKYLEDEDDYGFD